LALTPRGFTLSALEVELGIDRRTLGKRLASVPPASSHGKSKRWRMRDVLRALERDPVGGRAPVPTFREVPDEARRLAGYFLGPDESKWFPWDSSAVDLEEYARNSKVAVQDLLDWAMWGLPLLPPAAGDDALRISPWHADRWRALMCTFIESAGGDGLGDIAAEMRRLVGVA
jgi:hypothetical protein